MGRMKSRFEIPQRDYFQRGVPLILTLDGRSFSNYTKNLVKPFDEGLIEDMQQTLIHLCKNIGGAKCGYTQSDEMHVLVTDYDTHNTEPFFGYRKDKIYSNVASIATAKFMQLRIIRSISHTEIAEEIDNLVENIKLANFDCRGTSYPVYEVGNYFKARQRDAVRNSISMLAQSLYSHNQLNGKNQSEMQEMCFEKGHNWNDLGQGKKRGSFVVKNTYWDGELVETLTGMTHPRSETMYLEGNSDSNLFGKVIKFGETSPHSPVTRTKWEVIDTPLNFSQENFEKFITTT